jgi:ATP-dependent protease HslVU (ClpYQ) peptidase subunit
MSVVVVKVQPNKIEIASDSITVRGWTQSKDSNKFSKLIKINDLFLGSVGLAEESSLLQVFCATRKPEAATESAIVNFFSEFAEWKNKKIGKYIIENDYLLVVDHHAFQIERFFVQEIIDFMAIGAGRDFALAALHLGHDVRKAVAVACELSVYCEAPVKAYEITRDS